MKVSPNISTLLKKVGGTEIEKNLRIIVQLRNKNARLTTRAGTAPHRLGGYKELSGRQDCPEKVVQLSFQTIQLEPLGGRFTYAAIMSTMIMSSATSTVSQSWVSGREKNSSE